ncbi:hypothetical protein [Asticcacaulis sp.]|uniref:hypothetical protein n=1 Tax=unclassified Asticcacaulis TaxID=2628350 RepID=UPI0025BA3F01|nr:hypothetical protein [Asticcacaulis sp.]MCA1935001.1 hypothetical protein [Asticcacaulis sp.]
MIALHFLLNDVVFDLDPSRMMHPLDAQRFEALSIDYIAQLGKEMFAENPQAHRYNPERARRLCYLLHLKMPHVNAAQFLDQAGRGQAADVLADFKALNEMALGMMYQQQVIGQLDAAKVDGAVWHRHAA